MNGTAKHIQDRYDAGTSLFTREVLRKRAHGLERYRECTLKDQKFTLTGIDGVTYS